MHPNNNEDVLEVGPDVLRGERLRSRLLKDYGDNVVTYVPLSQELGKRKENMELVRADSEQPT